MLKVLGCGIEGQNRGTPTDGGNVGDPNTVVEPSYYSLEPSFFAGEPIEDTSSGFPLNRLIIRMQHDGRGVEVNDTLYFDVANSYEVARCLRGRTVNGVPDWRVEIRDYRDMVIDNWCDWSAGGDYPRIRLHPDGLVHASLSPLRTCPIPPRGAGTGGARVTGSAADGWVEFINFGTAGQVGVPSEMREPVRDPNFKVNFGERLRANFHIDLADDREISAPRRNEPEPTVIRLDGYLDGFFDFDFDRGRAAQAFP